MSIESKWGSQYYSKENPRNPEGSRTREILNRVREAFKETAEEITGKEEN